jgi:hypothetical protein
MAVVMMTMAGKRGDEAMARRQQGKDKGTEMRRQLIMVPAQAS